MGNSPVGNLEKGSYLANFFPESFHCHLLSNCNINPKRIMRGLRGPRKTSMDDPAAIIGTQEPIFHLIIHNIGPLCHAA